jgi:hypothetical protein
MTIARQERKSRRRAGCGAAGLAVALCVLTMAPGRIGATTTELVVADEYTGLAIYGFDPVAYFTDAAAAPGRPDLELRLAGVVWRFCNRGNLSAFAADPEVFMPRFGGRDPISIARGASAAGHPRLWLIVGKRLYLFYSEQARDAFAADPGRAIDAAERRWPQVRRSLVP